MSIRINPLSPAAAEIFGLDCFRPLTNQAFQVVESAFLDYPVLIFRDQNLSATDVASFGRRFGPLEGYGTPATTAGSPTETSKRPLPALRQIDGRETPDLMLYVNPTDPDVLIMSSEIRSDLNAMGIVDNAETWHSDASHRAEPCKAIVLYATRNPSAGGNTEFCDMRAVTTRWQQTSKPSWWGALRATTGASPRTPTSPAPSTRPPMRKVNASPASSRRCSSPWCARIRRPDA
jgi:alpha-ketoglutarate-dependent 2,4-dichlorophenoxyacetate dioxygenase